MSPRVIVVAIGLAAVMLLGASVNEAAAPIVVVDTTEVVSLAPSTLPSTRSIATLPTFTPPRETIARSDDAPRVGYVAVSLPSLAAQRSVTSLPTVTPSREREAIRSGCDPAYPDKRTCIPPGPPFDQGCAITDERRFTVIAPDPQRLDHDGDGIGCEPIPNN